MENSLKDSVKLRMIADVPISFLLSGGIDSSIITLLANEVSDGNIDSHYMGYGQKEDIFKDIARSISTKNNF